MSFTMEKDFRMSPALSDADVSKISPEWDYDAIVRKCIDHDLPTHLVIPICCDFLFNSLEAWQGNWPGYLPACLSDKAKDTKIGIVWHYSDYLPEYVLHYVLNDKWEKPCSISSFALYLDNYTEWVYQCKVHEEDRYQVDLLTNLTPDDYLSQKDNFSKFWDWTCRDNIPEEKYDEVKASIDQFLKFLQDFSFSEDFGKPRQYNPHYQSKFIWPRNIKILKY